jgi:hypothetical protein
LVHLLSANSVHSLNVLFGYKMWRVTIFRSDVWGYFDHLIKVTPKVNVAPG